jgi:integrase
MPKKSALHLTDRFCRSLKGSGIQTSHVDAEERGLELRVTADGTTKSWSIRYRLLDGQQRRFTIGEFPAIGVADARAKAAAIKLRVRDGGDPAGEKRLNREAAVRQPLKTVGDLADRYFEVCRSGEWKPRGRAKREGTIKMEALNWKTHLKPRIAQTRIDSITRSDVRAVLREVQQAGLGVAVNRVQALLRQMFSYAVAEERIVVNPAANLPMLVAEAPRERILSDSEMSTFWRVVTMPASRTFNAKPNAEVEPLYLARPMAIILQLAALTLQRRSEIAGMALNELDLDQGVWVIPAERAKGHRPHLVPLTPYALALVQEAIDLNAGRKTTFVFPSQRIDDKPMRGDSVTHSMVDVVKTADVPGIALHDLRRTGSTAMTSERLHVSPFIRSLVLGHATSGGGAAVTREHYDRNAYVSEKRAALLSWENLLLDIVGQSRRASNVIEMAR